MKRQEMPAFSTRGVLVNPLLLATGGPAVEPRCHVALFLPAQAVIVSFPLVMNPPERPTSSRGALQVPGHIHSLH